MKMVDYRLPYGFDGQSLVISDKYKQIILDPKIELPKNDSLRVLTESLKNPLNSQKLETLILNKSTVTIICDDYTRKLATEKILSVIIPILLNGGIKEDNITVLMSTGTHRQPKEEEIKKIMGKYYKKIRCIAHDCDSPDLIFVGTTSRGNEIYLNPYYTNADLKIILSDVGLHYYAGISGGRKSILPGIASRSSIQFNHAFLIDDKADTGKLKGNPVSEDMIEAAELMPPDFSICVIQSGTEIIHAATGNLDKTFQTMISQAKEYFIQKAPMEKCDILIVSAGGFPADINFYQGGKAIEHTRNLVKKNGTVIIVCEAKDGIGNKKFEEALSKYENLEQASNAIKKNFVMGEHKAFYWYKALERAKHIFVTKMSNEIVEELLKTNKFENLQSAFDEVIKENSNKNNSIIIVPNGATFTFTKD